MSSRLTAPVSKFTRSLSTTAPVARPSHLLNGSKAAANATASGRKRNSFKVEESDAADATRAHSTAAASPHRPQIQSQARPFRFMQTFHHSAPKPAAVPSASTIDSLILPDLSFESSYDPYANIRVPLLPDNRSPPAGLRQPEATDAPLPAPEILVVASNPEQVLPAALTEVEGMGVDGVELKFIHDLQEQPQSTYDEMGTGMIRDLWKGLVEDIMGPANSKKPAL